MSKDIFGALALIDQIEKSVVESIKEMDHEKPIEEADVEEGNRFAYNLKLAREQGKTRADLDGDGDMEKVQPANEGVKNEKPDMLDEGGMAFQIGDKVYFGSKEGTIQRFDGNVAIIKKPDGELDAAEINQLSSEKPGMMKRAASYMLGDDLQESQQLDECGMDSGSMSPMSGEMHREDSGNLNVSSNFDSRTGRRSLTVSAEGEQAEELAQILKLSGMIGDGVDHKHPDSMSVVGSMDAEGAEDLARMLRHSGVSESYVNEPDETVESTKKILDQGNDLNRKKGQHADKPRLGDNPRATEEDKIVESLEQKLWAEFVKEKTK